MILGQSSQFPSTFPFSAGRAAIAMYADKEGDFMRRTIASCYRLGVNPTVLGWGQKEWGYHTRWMAYVAFARKCLAEGVSHILFLDAWDTCLLNPFGLDEVVNTYGPFGLVFGAEANCWPDSYRSREYRELYMKNGAGGNNWTRLGLEGTPYLYLNCGVLLANCAYLCDLAAKAGLESLEPGVDDQRVMTGLFLQGQYDIAVDVKGHLAWNMWSHEDDGELVGCRLDTDGDGNCHIHPQGCPSLGFRLQSTGTRPVVAHGNGKSNIAKVYYALGL